MALAKSSLEERKGERGKEGERGKRGRERGQEERARVIK